MNNIVIGEKKRKLAPHIIDFGLSVIDRDTLLEAAHSLGIEDEVEEAQESFTREIISSYDDPDILFQKIEIDPPHCHLKNITGKIQFQPL